MKLSELTKKLQQEQGRDLITCSIDDLLSITEFDNQPERLSEKTLQKGCDSLNSTRQGGEVNPKRFARLVIGHKSNRI